MAWLFVMCVVLGVISAYFLRAKCSGPHLGFGLFCVCFIYNIFFITYYMRILEFSRFLFFGYHPEFIKENVFVLWVAMIGIFFHCGAMPSSSEK
ncbi:hypothetical protein IAE37_005125 [Pseudomonas sp. S31]|nr:hypothetical protein [Pseudomonas sp. S31]